MDLEVRETVLGAFRKHELRLVDLWQGMLAGRCES